jgi:hypothetical protein
VSLVFTGAGEFRGIVTLSTQSPRNKGGRQGRKLTDFLTGSAESRRPITAQDLLEVLVRDFSVSMFESQ